MTATCFRNEVIAVGAKLHMMKATLEADGNLKHELYNKIYDFNNVFYSQKELHLIHETPNFLGAARSELLEYLD